MSRAKNIVWIMCDQLRHDYLGCTGHPTLRTPNIDAMARARRALLQCLCAVADLRSLADVLLYRPLHAFARFALERLAAAGRRADARRPSQRRSACATCWSARPTWRRTRRHEAARHRARIRSSACMWRNAASSRMSGMTGCIRPAGRGRATMPTCASAVTTRPIPGSIGPIRPPPPTARCRMAGCWCTPTRPPAFRKSIPRRPT